MFHILVIYLREEFSYDIKLIQRDSDLWDGLFIDIQGGTLTEKLLLETYIALPEIIIPMPVSKNFLMN